MHERLPALALRARINRRLSLCARSGPGKERNKKSFRNPKQIQMVNSQMFKTVGAVLSAIESLRIPYGFLIFGFLSFDVVLYLRLTS